MGVSWGKAFRAALTVALYSLVWLVIGILLIFLGFIAIVVGNSVSLARPGFLLLMAGAFFIIFGFTASFLKVQTDLVAREVEKRLRAATPSPRAEMAGKQVESYLREGWVEVTVIPSGPFKTRPSGTARYRIGSTTYLQATPEPNHPFKNWSGDTDAIEIAYPNSLSTTATLNGSCMITANFS